MATVKVKLARGRTVTVRQVEKVVVHDDGALDLQTGGTTARSLGIFAPKQWIYAIPEED